MDMIVHIWNILEDSWQKGWLGLVFSEVEECLRLKGSQVVIILWKSQNSLDMNIQYDAGLSCTKDKIWIVVKWMLTEYRAESFSCWR